MILKEYTAVAVVTKLVRILAFPPPQFYIPDYFCHDNCPRVSMVIYMAMLMLLVLPE